MNFKERLDKAILTESALGNSLSEDGEKLDMDLTVSGIKYEVHRFDDHFKLVRNGIVTLVTEEDSEIKDKLTSILFEEIDRKALGTQNAKS